MSEGRYKQSEEAIEVRSTLMRLYHSYWADEEFYPARFVNGCAPALEASGFIERHGDGWRITEDGVDQWAEMNRHELMVLTSKANSWTGKAMRFLQDRLANQGDVEMSGICKKEGCGKPCHVSIGGKEFTYCHEHQKEQWAADKRAQTAKKASEDFTEKPSRPRATKPVVKPVVKSVGQFVDGEPDTVKSEVVDRPAVKRVEVTTVDPAKYVIRRVVSHVDENSEILPNDCDNCVAKGTIEALRAKSPKLAKLIDAMQAEVEAARELGI